MDTKDVSVLVRSLIQSYLPRLFCNSVIIICLIATAYSLGQIIKSVCVCQCVCPSASTLTVTFLDLFSPKLAQTYKNLQK